MADARAFTGNMEATHRLLLDCLTRPKGVTLVWRVETYGSLSACQIRARSFQTTFSSLRNRDRRMSVNLTGENRNARDLESRGPLDRVACAITPLPDDAGWQAWVGPAAALYADIEVIDNATGAPISGLGANPKSEEETLIDDAYLFLTGQSPRFSKKAYVRGERLGLWEPRGMFEAIGRPSEERMREIEEMGEDEWMEEG